MLSSAAALCVFPLTKAELNFQKSPLPFPQSKDFAKEIDKKSEAMIAGTQQRTASSDNFANCLLQKTNSLNENDKHLRRQRCTCQRSREAHPSLTALQRHVCSKGKGCPARFCSLSKCAGRHDAHTQAPKKTWELFPQENSSETIQMSSALAWRGEKSEKRTIMTKDELLPFFQNSNDKPRPNRFHLHRRMEQLEIIGDAAHSTWRHRALKQQCINSQLHLRFVSARTGNSSFSSL